jgi:hypothetical protein
MSDNDLTFPAVQKIELLRLEPGDIVVATVEANCTNQQADRIREVLEAKFTDHHVLIVSSLTLSVAREVPPVREPRPEPITRRRPDTPSR